MKKTNLSWNCLLATLTLGSLVATTSCVKNEESDGVKAIREAQAGKVNADAAYRQAEAALKQAEADKEALELKIETALYDDKLAIEKENLTAELINVQNQVANATKTLTSTKRALADEEAKKNATNPNLTQWQQLYSQLYTNYTTLGQSGLYGDWVYLVGEVNKTQREIIEKSFLKASEKELLLKKDSAEAKKDLSYQLNLLSIYEAVAGTTVTLGDTAKVLGKKGEITANDWNALKNTLSQGANAVDNQINSVKYSINNNSSGYIKVYDDAVAALATYRAGLYDDAEKLKVLNQKVKDYETQIEAVKSQIESIEDAMAKLLE